MSGIIFQGNPKVFHVDDYLSTRRNIRWLVKQHRNQIGVDDTAFVWRADGGQKGSGGIVAVGRVLTPPLDMEDDCPELWAETPRSRIAMRVEILLDDVRLDDKSGMLKRTDLMQEEALSGLLIFRFSQKTNYTLEPAQTERILALWRAKRGR